VIKLLADDNLTTVGNSFESAGEVDGITDGSVIEALRGTDVADNRLSGTESDANIDNGLTFRLSPLI